MSVFLTYFLLVGKKRGDGFYVGFQKMVNVYFMYHPSGWDIKYTFSLYYYNNMPLARGGRRLREAEALVRDRVPLPLRGEPKVAEFYLAPIKEHVLGLDIAVVEVPRRHLAVAYSKCRSRHRARRIPRSRCRSPSTPLPRRAPRPCRRPRPTAREPMSTRRVFRPPHARACWLRVCWLRVSRRTRATQRSE